MAGQNHRINVRLLGDGRKEPYYSEEIWCDHSDQCPFYKKGYCCRVATFSCVSTCAYGYVTKKRGYTVNSVKCSSFTNPIREAPEYNKLQYPAYTIFTRISDYCIFKLRFCEVNKAKDTNEYFLNVPLFISGISIIPVKDVTIDFLYKLCTYQPRGPINNLVILDYQKKVIPRLLFEVKAQMPELFENFISEYPEFKDAINMAGESALLKTINPSTVRIDDITWYWNGKTLTYVSGKSPISKAETINCLEIIPKDNVYVKISSDCQINSNTIFEG